MSLQESDRPEFVLFEPAETGLVKELLVRDISRDAFVFEDVDSVYRAAAYDCVDGQDVFYRLSPVFVKDQKRLVIAKGNVRIYR